MSPSGQRIDKWLWFARITKTRTLAAALVRAGQVRVNRQKVIKSSHGIDPGDVLTIVLHGRALVLKVLACGGPRRGAPSVARTLYEHASMPNPEGSAPEKEDARRAGIC